MNDSEFDQLLRSAGARPSLPADFGRSVWARIEAGEAAAAELPSPAARRWFPWLATTGLAAAITLGAWLGLQSRPHGEDAKAQYVRSISPFADHSLP